MKLRHVMAAAAMLATGMGTSAPAYAALLDFTGTRENVTRPPVPGAGRCGPEFFRTVTIEPGNLSSTGTSNFGAFTASMSHCEPTSTLPTDVVDGILRFDFEAGDSLFGTYTGQITASDTAGLFNVAHTFLITGGSGRFLDATGTINALGTLRPGLIGGAPAGTYMGALNGMLDLPAVPEPATWASMVAGFGLLGGALRTRRSRRTAAA